MNELARLSSFGVEFELDICSVAPNCSMMPPFRGLLEKVVFVVLAAYFLSEVAQSMARLRKRKIGAITSR